jgi:hypothetical protein
MKGTQTGFIAQEVEKLLPSTVLTESNKEKTKGLKYNEFSSILTKAIQELKTLVDIVATDGKKRAARTDETFARQDKEIAELREDDKELRQENAALRTAVCGLNSEASFCRRRASEGAPTHGAPHD